MTWMCRVTGAADRFITEADCHSPSRWAAFALAMLRCGYAVHLYEARTTVSKYLTVWNGDRSYRVRFSDHPTRFPDCDLLVGRFAHGAVSTATAIIVTIAYLD